MAEPAIDKFKWIKDFFDYKKEGDRFNRLSDIIPNEFDYYFLIHWSVGIVEKFPFEDFPKESESIEDLNKRIKILREQNLFLNPNEDALFKKTTLREIAYKFNVSYDYNTLDKFENIPAIKIIYDFSIVNLKLFIRQITQNRKLNLFVEDAFHYKNVSEQRKEIEDISIADYFKMQEEFHFDNFTYLFSENKDWCITTSEDLPMFLCINKEIIKQIEEASKIELFKLDYNQVNDYYIWF